jgi:hypothetical protein
VHGVSETLRCSVFREIIGLLLDTLELVMFATTLDIFIYLDPKLFPLMIFYDGAFFAYRHFDCMQYKCMNVCL